MPNRVAVIVPCYKRPEYTKRCLEALVKAGPYPGTDFFLVDDGSNDETLELFSEAELTNKQIIHYSPNRGLRLVLTHFFMARQKYQDYEYLVKVDNDCLVPAGWLERILLFLDSGWVDVVSPNVLPSNAAFKLGKEPLEGEPGLRRSETVGGLWAMRASLLDGVQFESIEARGLTGAYTLLQQLIIEKEPRVGWLQDVVVQDLGHWSGEHPEHIKSQAHLDYSVEVGRRVIW